MVNKLNEGAQQEQAGEKNPDGGDVGQGAALESSEQGGNGLSKANARLQELEQSIAAKDSESAALRQAKVELEARVANINISLTEAIASYRAMVVAANPEVFEELISGDTIVAINESLGKAKTLISKVRQGVEAELSLVRVPAGAPERTLPDLSSLSPREKIQYAVGGFSG